MRADVWWFWERGGGEDEYVAVSHDDREELWKVENQPL